MVKSILVGLDGTDCGQAAVELGIRWARSHQAELLGLGIVDEPTIMAPTLVPVAVSLAGTEFERCQLKHARREVTAFEQDFATRCREAGVLYRVLDQHALPWEIIAAEARRTDLVMLGRQTKFQFETRGAPDSTLRRVLKDTPRPLVVVPESAATGEAVVIGCDGSPVAARAVYAFATSGLMPAARVHLIAVSNRPDPELAMELYRTVEFLRNHGFTPTPELLESFELPSDLLLAKADEVNAGLLVLGVQGRSAVRDVLAGSVTRFVLQTTKVPLFLYR